MFFPAFIGRTSGVWHPQHNFIQLQSLLNSGSSWSLLPRSPVSPLFGTGFGFLYLQYLSIWREEVLWLLLATWKNSSVWLPMPNQQVDVVSLCDVFGQHCSTFNDQARFISLQFACCILSKALQILSSIVSSYNKYLEESRELKVIPPEVRR